MFSMILARVTLFTQRCLTGLFIFVRRYCTQYDYNRISSNVGVFFGFVYLFAIFQHQRVYEADMFV